MPEIRTFKSQPRPVTAQVELPPNFPEVPREIRERFPDADTWNARLKEFWTTSVQALQEAQQQTAQQVNSTVVFDVDAFLINVNGVGTPMFTVDSTGVRLGGVLNIDTAYRSVYIGIGEWADANTPFFVDDQAFFSLGDALTWDPENALLSITGTIVATSGTIGGFDIGADYIRDTANSMGLASTVSGSDDVRFWAGAAFAARATAPFRVTESGILNATNNAVIVGSVSGRLTATLAAAIDASGNLITDVVNARLDSSAKTILSDFNFGSTDYAGGVKAGTITWNTTTGAITGGSGVAVYRGGIVGAASGIATFAINAVTGAATFAGTLSAPSGNIGGWTINSTTLTGGNATIDSVGQIILGTSNDVLVATAADSTHRLWIGNATAGLSAFNVTKTGVMTATAAIITGSVTATTGNIGGWTIGATTLTGGTTTLDSAGIITLGTSNDVLIASSADATYRLWIGNALPASAPFTVTKAGVLTATGAVISGSITATSGTIGGWTVGATTLTGGNATLGSTGVLTLGTSNDVFVASAADATYRIWVGNSAAASAPFRVTKTGALTATGVTVTGSITATSGTIGGWTASATTLTGGNATLDSAGILTLGTINDVVIVSASDSTYRLWVGHATASSAPFNVTKAGAVTATSGTIGGWTLSSTTLVGGNATLGSTGVLTLGTSNDVLIASAADATYRLWIGNATAGSAPFSVTKAGAIAAISGTIGGWTLSSTALTGGSATLSSTGVLTLGTSNDVAIISAADATYRLWIGHATASSGPFRVTKGGALTATGVTVSGSITATSGTIGGWTASATTLVGGSATLDSAGVLTLGTSNDVVIISASDATYRIWIGNATAASAPFRVTKAGAVTATSGTVGGWTLSSSTLVGGSATLDSSGVLTLGTSNDVFIASASDATYRVWIGNTTAASAPFRVTKGGVLTATGATITGTITATAGAIGGFDIGADYIRDAANTMGLASTVTGGDDVRFWAGIAFASRSSAPFRVTEAGVLVSSSGTIGGWTISSTTLTSAGGGVVLDNTNNRISVGTGSPNILIDGAAATVGTSTFASGQLGWRVDADGTGELNNIIARGEFRSSVFVKDEIYATGGTMLVLGAGSLLANFTSVTSPATSTMDIQDPPSGHAQLFAVNDILRIKDGSGLDNWLKVTAVSDQTTFYRYTVEKQSGTNGTFYPGTAVVNYKQSADGFVLLTSDLSNAPYVDIGVSGATPWSGTTAKSRLGNLAGITDATFGSLSGYGLWTDSGYFSGSVWASAGRFGTSTNYWLISSGVLVATGSGDVAIRAGQTDYDTGTGFWLGLKTGGARFSIGNASGNKLTWNGTTLAITGTITASAGTIGGWTVGSSTLTGGSATLDSAGVLTLGTSNDVVIASASDATYRLWVGHATAASAPFRVTKGGALTATSATITGSITATSGAIGGFDIGSDYIRDTANSFGLASTVSGSDDVRFWAGNTFVNRATAPFRVYESGAIYSSSGTIGGFTIGATTLTGGSSIILDVANGEIGIGTTNPHAPFDAMATGDIHLTFGTITTFVDNHTYMNLYFDTGDDCAVWEPFTHNVAFRNIALIPGHSDGSNNSKVGIGTFTPSHLLTLYSTTVDPIITLSTDDASSKARLLLYLTTGALSSSNVDWRVGVFNGIQDYVIAAYDGSSNLKYFNLKNNGQLVLYRDNTQVTSASGVVIEQDGTGDACLSLLLSSTRRWNIGVDNSDSDRLKILSDNSDDFSGTGISINTDGTTGILNTPSTTAALTLAASATGVAPLRIPHGTAPSSPVDGDIWTTTSGLFVRINGVTVGPLT